MTRSPFPCRPAAALLLTGLLAGCAVSSPDTAGPPQVGTPATATATADTEPSDPRGDAAPVLVSGTVDKVVDGDTLDIGGTRVRLAIVDTPEVHGQTEACGPQASSFTADFVGGQQVAVLRPASAPTTDPYERTLGEVVRASDGASLNVALVAAGLGEVDSRFADEDPDLAARLEQAAGRAGTPACATP